MCVRERGQSRRERRQEEEEEEEEREERREKTTTTKGFYVCVCGYAGLYVCARVSACLWKL